jgi:uncharacterized membrane protein
MTEFIEPNLHPIFVHFVVGLLITAVVAQAASLAPVRPSWRLSLQTAADWMLFLGLAAAVAAVAAGFQAYGSVVHDGPAHESMKVHRNWALVTAGVFILLGVWRAWQIPRPVSKPLAFVLIIAAGLLTTTAWWGGRLVFHHGLGVESLPNATEGGGHHHGADDSSQSRSSTHPPHQTDRGVDSPMNHGGPDHAH